MSSKIRKLTPAAERGAAIAGIRRAEASHPHTAIRPQRERRGDKHSEGFEISRAALPTDAFDRAMDKAAQAWPDENSWEVIGANQMGSWPNEGDDYDGPGDGCYLDPDVYAQFSTYDDDQRMDPNSVDNWNDSLGGG